MLSMFCAASRPIITTEHHKNCNLESLMEPQSDSITLVKTAASSTVFVVRRAFESMVAVTMRDLGYCRKIRGDIKARAMNYMLELTKPTRNPAALLHTHAARKAGAGCANIGVRGLKKMLGSRAGNCFRWLRSVSTNSRDLFLPTFLFKRPLT